jgi:hypothetical protein
LGKTDNQLIEGVASQTRRSTILTLPHLSAHQPVHQWCGIAAGNVNCHGKREPAAELAIVELYMVYPI